jgi:TonB family protein
MILRLLESQRARRFAGGALAASVAVHLSFAGAASQPPHARPEGAPEPISVRFLIPPNRAPAEVVEHINWAAIGPGTNGWELGDVAEAAAFPSRGGDEVALATHLPDVPAVPDVFQPAATFQEYEVDSAATRDPASGGPEYPDELRAKGVQGEVLVEFAVDTTGLADSTTFTVVAASHPEFARAVRDALPRMLFVPAIAQGRRVRQLVRLPMKFKLLAESAQGAT